MNRWTSMLTLLIAVSVSWSVWAQERPRQNRNVGIATLISHAAVHTELDLDDPQRESLKKAGEDARKATQSAQELSEEARRAKNGEITKNLRSLIAKTLNADQQKRFLQIEMQWSSGAWILQREEVAQVLALTREQRQKIREVSREMQQAVQGLRASQNDDNRQQVQRKITATLAAARNAALEVLTDEQRAEWKKANGEPFVLPAAQRHARRD